MPRKTPLPKTGNTTGSGHGGSGGARKRAGRPPGATTLRRREAAAAAIAAGVTPLEVMLEAMRTVYKKDGAKAAFSYARDCAPFVHPRIAQMELSNKPGEELRLIQRIERVIVRADRDGDPDASDG